MTAADKLRQMFADGDVHTAEQLKRESRLPSSTVSTALRGMVQNDEIRRVARGSYQIASAKPRTSRSAKKATTITHGGSLRRVESMQVFTDDSGQLWLAERMGK